jgi:hypothetical protein
MKLKFLFAFALGALFLASCGDDDEPKKDTNYFTYDGAKKKILTATYDVGNLENGNYDLAFSSDGEETDIFYIELSGEQDGVTVDLSEVDDEFDWSWWVEFDQVQGEDWVEVFEGFGGSEDSFNDVTGGELYVKLVDDEEMIFDVKATVTTTAGKNFKLEYKGKFTPNEGGSTRKRSKN